jgi:hypothetical protein
MAWFFALPFCFFAFLRRFYPAGFASETLIPKAGSVTIDVK